MTHVGLSQLGVLCAHTCSHSCLTAPSILSHSPTHMSAYLLSAHIHTYPPVTRLLAHPSRAPIVTSKVLLCISRWLHDYCYCFFCLWVRHSAPSSSLCSHSLLGLSLHPSQCCVVQQSTFVGVTSCWRMWWTLWWSGILRPLVHIPNNDFTAEPLYKGHSEQRTPLK